MNKVSMPTSEPFKARLMGAFETSTGPKKLEQLIANSPISSGNRSPASNKRQKTDPVIAS